MVEALKSASVYVPDTRRRRLTRVAVGRTPRSLHSLVRPPLNGISLAMRQVGIREISLDAFGRLLVVPALPPEEDFAFI
jgi:hypothetical protein